MMTTFSVHFVCYPTRNAVEISLLPSFVQVFLVYMYMYMSDGLKYVTIIAALSW